MGARNTAWAVLIVGLLLALPAAAQTAPAPGPAPPTPAGQPGPAAPAAPEAPREALVDTAIPFVPGAVERRTDTPSVFVWGSFQQGVAAGWHYRISPDASAVFSPSPRLDMDRIVVTCRIGAGCAIAGAGTQRVVEHPTGTHLPDGQGSGMAVALAYVDWVMGHSDRVAVPPPAPPPPAAQAPPRPQRGMAARAGTDLVRRIQQALAGLHYYDGPVNGVLGPKTRAAIRKAQADHGLPPTGQASPDLLKSLTGGAAPKPAGKASTGAPAGVVAPFSDFVQKFNVDCSLSAGVSIKYDDDRTGRSRTGKIQSGLNCGLVLLPGLIFRGGIVLFPIQDQQQPWDPDYIYALDYQVTDSWTLEYASYSGNRWPWHESDSIGGLTEGTFRVSYRLPFQPTLIPSDDPAIGKLDCSAFASYAPLYTLDAGGNAHNKTIVGVTCGIRPIDRLDLRVTAYAYPDREQQQPWDPDFTYSVNYAITDKWSVEYANYAGNRWPWDDRKSSSLGLASGTISVNYKLGF